jgi:putative redox protein
MTAETKRITLEWQKDLIFRGGERGGPAALVDGDNATAPGPMLHLLLAAASCTASDVVIILRKMRLPPARLTLEEQEPRRYIAIHFIYRLAGEGIDEARARRAVELSLEKYCSVINSLAQDISITYELALG